MRYFLILVAFAFLIDVAIQEWWLIVGVVAVVAGAAVFVETLKRKGESP